MRSIFDLPLLAGIGILLSFLVINAGVDHYTTHRLHEHSSLVAHADEVLAATGDVFSTLKDAETGQRGFLITGDASYLRPYDDATKILKDKLAHLKQLTAGNQRRQADISRLEELVRQKLDELGRDVNLQRHSGAEAARQEILARHGKNTMDELRVLLDSMETSERSALHDQEIANENAYHLSIVSSFLSQTFGMLAVLGFVWLLWRHLSARAQAAAALHDQREWFRTTLSSIGDAVIATDTSGQVQFINAIARNLTGYENEQAVGQPVVDVFKIVNEDTRGPVDSPVISAIQKGTTVGLANHTLLISRTGTECPIDDSAAPIRNEAGQVVGAVLVFRDISERRRSEQAVHDANRRKDEFIAILGHELRNAMAPLHGAVELWQLQEPLAADLGQTRDMIERQVHQLTRLLDDLYDVSCITAGQLSFRTKRIDATVALRNAIESSRRFVDAAGHQLTVKLPKKPVYLDADEGRLVQIFQNLLNNAAKYTPPNGKIQLDADLVTDNLVVSVRDNGIGLKPEMLRGVFELFARVDDSKAQNVHGLGIGLSVVRRLVELHGGTIEARSEGEGKGTEFIVRLPVIG
jgi:PAS domain S-box-containing protein